MRRFIEWVRGWTITLDIKFNHPELYRELTKPYDIDLTNFREVDRP